MSKFSEDIARYRSMGHSGKQLWLNPAVWAIPPLGEQSPITAALAKGNGASYHLCFETTDLEQALIHAKNYRCLIVSRPVPAIAFDGRRIAWIMTPSRQLFELVEAAV